MPFAFRSRKPPEASAPPPRAELRGPAVPFLFPDPSEGRIGRATNRVAVWSLRFILIVIAAWMVLWALGLLWVVVLPVALGLLLTTVLWPPTRVLRRVMPPAAAALVVIVGGFLLLGGLGALLAPQVAAQTPDLVDAVVRGLEDLRRLVSGPPFNLGEERIGELLDQAVNQLQSNTQSIASGVLTGVTTAGTLLINTVLALVLSFFFLKDGPKFVPWSRSWVGRDAAPHVAELAQRSWDTLSGFIRAQAAVGLVDAVAIGIGLAILGIPLALPLAVLIFFGAFIPIVGAFVTGALAALVALVTNGWVSALIVIALVVIVQQVEGNVLQPIFVGRAVDLYAALVILAVTAGGALAGIVGAFLAVPVFAVGTTVARYIREQVRQPQEAPADGVAGDGR